MSNQRTSTSRLILQTIIDKQNLNNARADLERLRGNIRQLSETAKQADVVAASAGKSIRAAFDSRVSTRIDAIAKSNDRLKKSFDEVKQAAIQARNAELDASDPNLGGGGRQAFGQKLRTLGREGKALPAVAIPGLGISSDAVSKIVGLVGVLTETLPSRLIKTTAALGAMGAALIILSAKANEAKQAALEELDARQRALTLLQAGNKEEVQSRIKALQEIKANNEQAVNDANFVLNGLRDGITDAFGPVGVFLTEFNSALGTGAGELSAAKEDADKAAKALQETNTELVLLEQGVDGLGDAAASAALKLAQAQSLIAQNQARISAQIEAANLAASATEEEVQKRLESLAREKDVLIKNLPILEKQLSTAEEGSEAQKAFQSSLDSTRQRVSELDTTMLTLAGDALQAAKANDELKFAVQQQKDLADATKKYNTDVAKIEEDAQKARIDSTTKYLDSVIKIAEQAADAAEDALQKLKERRDSLLLDFQREEASNERKAQFEALEKQIEFQEEEAKEARDHQRDLLKIRRDAEDREFDLILNRDFAGLFASRRETEKAINDANTAYTEQRNERLLAFQQENTDNAAQREFELQSRYIKYEQDLADAQAQYAREQAQIEVNRRKALEKAAAAYNQDQLLLQQKYTNELQMRRQAIEAELQMISQSGQQRILIEGQIQQALVAQAKQILAGISSTGSNPGGGVRNRAFGGSLGAGQMSFVNELPGQQERFNGIRMPGGSGLFMPLTAGNVTPGNSGAQVTVIQYISGNNPEQIARLAGIEARKVIQQVFN